MIRGEAIIFFSEYFFVKLLNMFEVSFDLHKIRYFIFWIIDRLALSRQWAFLLFRLYIAGIFVSK